MFALFRGKGIYFAIASVLGLFTEKYALLLVFILLGNLFLWIKDKRLIITYNLAFFLMMFNLFWVEEGRHPAIDLKETKFLGEVLSIPKIDGDLLQAYVLVQPVKAKIVIRKKFNSQADQKKWANELKPGMICLIHGQALQPDAKKNFHGFDYQMFLKRKNIFYQIEATSLQCQNSPISPLEHLERWRQWGINKINRSYPEEIRGLVNALIFGDRNTVPADILDAYQSLGLIHLLAVSGLHIGMISAVLFYLLIRIGLTRERASGVLFLIIPCYMILSGGAPSVIRAGLMTLALLLTQWRRLTIPAVDLLSFIFILMLFVNPYYIYDIGFDLSFAVTFGLLLSYSIIKERYRGFHRLLVTSIIAQLSALPILLSTFYSFSILGVLLNLIFIPFITLVVLPLSFLSFFIVLIAPHYAALPIIILKVAIVTAHDFLIDTAQWRISTINLGQPTLSIFGVLIISIIACLVIWELFKNLHIHLILAGLIVLVLLSQTVIPYLSPYGKVTFLNVGQGDAILIELPHREAIYLIDTGGEVSFKQEAWRQRMKPYKVGRDVVLNELRAKGIHQIDQLILTHHDMDHVGGMEELIGKIPIKNIMINPSFNPSVQQRALFKKAQSLGTKIFKLSEGAGWKVGSNVFHVLNPQGTEQGNDLSIVIYAILGNTRFLFTGDLEQPGEKRLIQRYGTLPIDILKIGHHGSRSSTSNAFLDDVSPKLAIISVGKNNRYGHPAQEVLSRLNERGIPVLRTDRDGAIQMTFSENSLKIAITRKEP